MRAKKKTKHSSALEFNSVCESNMREIIYEGEKGIFQIEKSALEFINRR